MFVIAFKVTLDDGANKLELEPCQVEWLEGGDTKVRVNAAVDVGQGDVLDKWESSGTELSVDIVPSRCARRGPAGDLISSPCSEEVKDYVSQSGKGKISWVYNPSGDSQIIIEFTEVE